MQRSLLRLSRTAVRSASRQTVFPLSARVTSTPISRQFSSTSRFLNESKKEEAASEATSEPASKSATESATEAPPADESPIEKELRETKEKLLAKDKEAAEFKDRYIRSVADFRNLQETTKREIQKAKDFALQKFAKDLIESIDNFGHALSAVKEDTLKTNAEVSQLYDGVKMTRDIFEKTLHRHGMVKIDPLHEEFDPNKHEATFQAPSPDKEPGTVMFVQQPGFELNGRVLRAAKVGIVKEKE